MKKIIATIFAISALFVANAEIHNYLLSGVDYESQTGFYDSNKIFNGKDDNLCWAFSASNQLQRWQDKQSQEIIKAHNIPNGIMQTQTTYQLDIAYNFVQKWANNGGNEINGFNWWTKGTNLNSGGKYWADFLTPDTIVGDEVDLLNASKNIFFTNIIQYVNYDYGMTLGIYNQDGAHAVTLWGCGYDSFAQSCWIYISDSDDYATRLYKSTLSYSNNKWYLDNENYKDWYVGDITYFSLGVIPEPATYALILGIIILAIIPTRRLV